MKSRRQFVAALAASLAVPATWVRARVVTCAKCGYEVTAGEGICGHCGAPVPASAAGAEPVPENAPAPGPAAGAGLSREAVMGLEQAARQAGGRGTPASAMLLARQAEALAVAVGMGDVARQMDLFAREQGDAFRLGTQACPACRGQRMRKVLFANFAGEVQEQSAPNLRCPVCDGRGTVRAQLDAERFRARMAEAQRTAESFLRALRYADAGGIWVPEAEVGTLTPRVQAALRATFGRACASCAGFGTFGCDSCGGAGRKPCEEACVMGQVVCPECEGKRRATTTESGRTLQQGCKTCKQTGVASCAGCAGRGWTSCTKCAGQGGVPCGACKGVGQAAACSKCEGRGLTDCRNCKGTGSYRGAICSACQGGKQMLCTSCNGYGRKRR